VDDRREPNDVGRGRAAEREDDGDRRDAARPSELAAVLGVAEPEEREAGLGEDARGEPPRSEEH
jgi:hypothetical protein